MSCPYGRGRRVCTKLCVVLFVAVCLPALLLAEPTSSPQQMLWLDGNAPIEDRVKALLAEMTLAEKIAQLTYGGGIGGYPLNLSHVQTLYPDGTGALGCPSGDGIQLSAIERNALQGAIINASRLKIPTSFYQETMRSAGILGCTIYPVPAGLGATWNQSLVQQIGRVIAVEAGAIGLDRSLSPVMQVAHDQRWGRTSENFGEDALLVATMGAAMTEGLLGPGNGGGSSTYLINNSASLIVTAKHGVAYGVSNSDGYAADMSDRKLMEVFMRPWRAFAAKGGRGLMISHPTLNHVPMHANAAILNGTLRNLLGLNQALFGSDYENVKWLSDAFHYASNHSDAAVKALYAGVDQEMQNVEDSLYQQHLAQAVLHGVLDESVVDISVANVLRAKFAAGLFDDRTFIDTERASFPTVRSNEAIDLARQAAQQSITLLANSKMTLPLEPKDYLEQLGGRKKIAVLGPIGGGCPEALNQTCFARLNMVGPYSPYGDGPVSGPTSASSSVIDTKDTFTPVYTVEDGLRALGARVSFAAGANVTNETFVQSQLEEAVSLAQSSDAVVLVLGDTHETCGEAFDRTSLDLPGTQLHLLHAVLNATGNLDGVALPSRWAALRLPPPYRRPDGPIPVIVVLVHGRTVTFDAENHNWLQPGVYGQTALLSAWQPSEQGGLAIADILFGSVNPTGKTNHAWPRSAGHIHSPSSPYLQQPNSQQNGPWIEPTFSTWEPLFPFAHGLSYTTFEMYGLDIYPSKTPIDGTTPITVSTSVTNTGQRDGGTTVFVFATQVLNGVIMYPNRLVGWAKVAAIPAGAAAKIDIPLLQSRLRP